jgi:diguanylate cyclase (GGDEF)-like protein
MTSPTARKSRNLFRRQGVRLQKWLTLGSVGIAPRLILAFASVAALAAAANLIVENGVAILERQRSVEMERSAIDSQAIETLRGSVTQAKRVVASAELSVALGQFDRAVQEHAEADSGPSAARLAKQQATLNELLVRYALGEDPTSPSLRGAIATHKRTGETLVQTTRLRRSLTARYWTLLASMDARINGSIDQSWKVLGHVMTRPALLDLRARLDALRVAFANPVAAGVDVAERELTQSLRANEAVLKRSEGLVWFNSALADQNSLVATRTAFLQNETRRVAALDGFARESRRLMAQLPARFEEPQASGPTIVKTVSSNVPEGPSRWFVAWMSAAVLVVLTYVCFVTIFSIVRPVRRLITATHKLAQGGNARVVASGGIRELESLAVAFNSMAQQLSVARAATADAQQRLEAKVEERTRQLQELAEQDPLTGIANRRQLFVALNEALDRSRANGKRVAVYFLDIDNFKTLNDSMGHPYGDRVLIAIARRLENVANVFGFAARLGGDEFTVVHVDITNDQEVLNFGTTIIRAFELPLQVDERELILSVSVGASVFPDHEKDAEALLRAADTALFRAKALGRSQLALFTPELLATASAKFTIEQGLRRALQNGEFELFYQPLVDLEKLDVGMVEALIRWRMPDGSYRTPDNFLAVAEESGLIVEISDWVLREAIRTAARWHRGAWPEARMAINVSARHFLDFRFVERLQQLLAEFDLPARCLELELTESVLQTGSHTIRTLEQLRAIGVAIALDDFGTGYSSLASLQNLPLTRVKLDRSLIGAIDESVRAASIARATIALCRGLGLEVTAEGVERLEQFATLLPHRALTLQGYLFSRPVSADEMLRLLGSLPASCRDLLEQAQKLPTTLARGEKRRGLTIVGD